MRLDDIGVFVKNMKIMVEFYRDVFEFEIEWDVDTIYQTVISKGATSIMGPETEPWGQRTCFIADPEGNLVEIGSFDKE